MSREILDELTVMTRWAPSNWNSQPWRLYYFDKKSDIESICSVMDAWCELNCVDEATASRAPGRADKEPRRRMRDSCLARRSSSGEGGCGCEGPEAVPDRCTDGAARGRARRGRCPS